MQRLQPGSSGHISIHKRNLLWPELTERVPWPAQFPKHFRTSNSFPSRTLKSSSGLKLWTEKPSYGRSNTCSRAERTFIERPSFRDPQRPAGLEPKDAPHRDTRYSSQASVFRQLRLLGRYSSFYRSAGSCCYRSPAVGGVL